MSPRITSKLSQHHPLSSRILVATQQSVSFEMDMGICRGNGNGDCSSSIRLQHCAHIILTANRDARALRAQ